MTKTNEQSIIDISKKAARLGRVSFTEQEHSKLAPQLEKILAMFEQLQAINTDGVAPLANGIGENLKLRADEVTYGGYAERVLGNAPDEVQGFFGVPKVVE